MDQNVVLLMGERVQDLICARKNTHKDRPVARAVQNLVPTLRCGLLSCCDRVSHVMHFFESFSDYMNIADVSKNNFTIRVSRVGTAVLVAATLELICASIKQRSSIVDLHESRLVHLRTITLADLPNKLFIPSIPRSEKERARLTASPNGSTCNLIEIAQGWKAVRRTKSCTFFDGGLVN